MPLLCLRDCNDTSMRGARFARPRSGRRNVAHHEQVAAGVPIARRLETLLTPIRPSTEPITCTMQSVQCMKGLGGMRREPRMRRHRVSRVSRLRMSIAVPLGWLIILWSLWAFKQDKPGKGAQP